MQLVQSLAIFGITGLLFVGVAAVASKLALGHFRQRLGRMAAAPRHVACVALALSPALFGFALLFIASLPALASLFAPHIDHCALHDDHHVHLCFLHPPAAPTQPWVFIVVGAAGLYLALTFGSAFWNARRALRSLGALSHGSEVRRDLGATIVETELPLCFAAGLFGPRVYLSRGLLNALSESERRIVLLHEFAHVERRDTLLAFIARLFAVFHTRSVQRFLLAELQVAAEQACDERAADAVGDRLAVASAILKVERLLLASSAQRANPLALAIGECAVERRVTSLLEDAPVNQGFRAWVILGAAASALVLVLTQEFHHLTETLLSIFVM